MTKMKNPWKKISGKVVYKNPWIEVIEDKVIHPNGKKGIYGVVRCGFGTRIVAITKNNKIVMNYEYRYAANKAGWEIPAGGVMDGLSPLENAKKELFEETGLKANKWTQLIGVDVWPSATQLTDYIFLAEEVEGKISNKGVEGNEGIFKTQAFTIQDIKKMIMAGEIFCGSTISGIFAYLIHTKKF